MSVLFDLMVQVFCGSDVCCEVLDVVLCDGLLVVCNEVWKYILLCQLECCVFVVVLLQGLVLDVVLLDDILVLCLVFVNGCLDVVLSDVQVLLVGVQLQLLLVVLVFGEDVVCFFGCCYECSEEIFVCFNVVLVDEGVVLYVDEGVQVEVLLQLVFVSVVGEIDLVWYYCYLIELCVGVSFGVVEYCFSVGDFIYLDNIVLYVYVVCDVVFKYVCVQVGSVCQISFLCIDVVLVCDVQYYCVDLELGVVFSCYELNV